MKHLLPFYSFIIRSIKIKQRNRRTSSYLLFTQVYYKKYNQCFFINADLWIRVELLGVLCFDKFTLQ